jgi:hypothetical protein
MPIWTVDVWTVRPDREPHFLQHCGELSPEQLTLYRDVEKPGVFWSPAKWGSREELDEWRRSEGYVSVVASLSEDVAEHVTHVMEDVPGYPPSGSPIAPPGATVG